MDSKSFPVSGEYLQSIRTSSRALREAADISVGLCFPSFAMVRAGCLMKTRRPMKIFEALSLSFNVVF
jgi:hypothetical protein